MTTSDDGDVCDVFVSPDQQEESALLGVVGPPIDEALENFLNTVHVPKDAGEYADDLRVILNRIPEHWGRWISCAKGWYPMIIELDKKLAEIAPEYQLHQVKEKFGTLRYYVGLPDLTPQCCIDMEKTQPYEGPINPRWRKFSKEEWTAEQQYELDKWFYTVRLPHFDSPEHIQQHEELEPERQRRSDLYTEMYKIIDKYEELSAETCELCGGKAQLNVSGYWLRTLCATCAEENGYVIYNEEEEE